MKEKIVFLWSMHFSLKKKYLFNFCNSSILKVMFHVFNGAWIVFQYVSQAVLKMLNEIGSADKIPEFLDGVKNR